MRLELEARLDTAMEEAKSTDKLVVTNFLGNLWGDYRLKQAWRRRHGGVDRI